MAKKVVKTSLAAKLKPGSTSAIAKAAQGEIDWGVGSKLPPGINNGIARLITCGFGEYKTGQYKGEPFFRASASVIEPKYTDKGQKVEGLHTSIMIPVCDTKKRDGSITPQDEHLVSIVNEMRKMGATFSAEPDADELESVAAALEETKPYLRFSTSESEAKDGMAARTWENWHGSRGLEDYVEGESADTTDNSADSENEGPKPAPKPAPKTAGKAPSSPATATKGTGKGSGTSPPSKAATGNEEEDLDNLAALADGGDEDAKVRIDELAEQAGVDMDEYAQTENYAAGVELIRAAQGESEPSQEKAHDLQTLGYKADQGNKPAVATLTKLAEEAGLDPDEYDTWAALVEALEGSGEEGEGESEWVPEKAEIYMFKPAGAKRAMECEVLAVFPDKKTVNLKCLDDNKSYKGIAWDKLEGDKG